MQGNYKGLSEREAKIALERHGRNEIQDTNKVTLLGILLRQMRNNFVVYLLFVTAVISFAVGKSITAYTICAVIVLVIATGFIQEYRADKSIASLKRMVMPVSIVIRGGKKREVDSAEIVPEDIVVLSSGDRVPADAVVIAASELRVDESLLTGESVEVGKSAPEDDNTEDINRVFMGTFVVNGRAYVKTIATGMQTRFGQIAGMIADTEKALPLQRKVNKISKYMVGVAITMSLLTGTIMLLRTPVLDADSLVNILILVIALSVAAFPEGFPVVLITTLSTGANRMAKQNTIVNRMSIIETLGETTIICTDKTGTITKGEMTVNRIYMNGKTVKVTGSGYVGSGDFLLDDAKINPKEVPGLEKLIRSAVICNDARVERTGDDAHYKVGGTPTEGALLIMGVKADIHAVSNSYVRIEEMPFSSERKMMSTLVKEKSGMIVYAKGAPEVIIKRCSYLYKDDKHVKLTAEQKRAVVKANQAMTTKALRTLAIAYKPLDSGQKHYEENDLVLLGLVGMEDPPRPEAKEAIEACKTAGIKVMMITGDNKNTARAIAREVGFSGDIITGRKIDMMDDRELAKSLKHVAVFARVRPEHKLRIVNLLKARGEIVTMTGDGVNDAPALKGAHIGVAMGKNGTDVSRSVADITLKDDNFATIVLAIKEGRTIFNNIRKFVTYQLSCNLAELTVLFMGVLLAPLLGWEVPLLLALHILFMNLVTDNLPAITLGLNKSSKDIINEPPRKGADILTKQLFYLLIFNGLLMGTITLIVYYISVNILEYDVAHARTIALVTLIMLEIASAFNFRSFRYSALLRSPFVNIYLVIASTVSFLATLAILYTPLSRQFETVPLTLSQWVVPMASAFLIMLVFDGLKVYSNRTGQLFARIH